MLRRTPSAIEEEAHKLLRREFINYLRENP
jgi:hypothetical protein